MIRRRYAALLASSLLLAGSACSRRPMQPPNLVLIVIDTLRADHLGAYGYGRPTSPRIDALAERGVTFTNAMAPSSWTKPSIGSLFTSRPPLEHGAVAIERPLAANARTLAELLQDAGYRTVGLSANFVHVNDRNGFDRGFDRFEAISRPAENGDPLVRVRRGDAAPVPLRAPDAAELTDAVLAALPAPGTRPIFLYVHYMDPHSGYDPPATYRSRFAREPDRASPTRAATSDYVVELAAGRSSADEAEQRRLIDLYDAEIAYVDAELGRLLDALEDRGDLRNAVVVVTADHGEEFGDHGGWFHGLTLHNELLHIPLIVSGLAGPAGSGRRTDPVGLFDVAPTLLAAAGVAPAAGMRGQDVRSEIRADRSRSAWLLPDPMLVRRTGLPRHVAAQAAGAWKAIAESDGAVAVYDLERDPGEQVPREPDDDATRALASQARALAAEADALALSGDAKQLSPRERDALRSLGYAE